MVLVLVSLWVLVLVLVLVVLALVWLVQMLGRYVVVSAFGSTKDGHMWGPHARWRKPPGAALGAETRGLRVGGKGRKQGGKGKRRAGTKK